EAGEFDRLVAEQVADGAPQTAGHVGVNVSGVLDRDGVLDRGGHFAGIEVGRVDLVNETDGQVVHLLAFEQHAAEVDKATLFRAGRALGKGAGDAGRNAQVAARTRRSLLRVERPHLRARG